VLNSRHAFAAALAAIVISVAPVMSEPYSKTGFDAAMKAGAPVVVHVDATWCPTCMMQKPILSKLLTEERYGRFREFVVDYDKGKDTMRALKARTAARSSCSRAARRPVGASATSRRRRSRAC
jgi:thiol-disulfide isomerase/thioredoxin